MVYFIQIVNGGPVKVGFTNNVDKRIADIRVGLPHGITILAVVEGKRKEERKALTDLWPYRLRGEWFRPTKEVIDYVNKCKEIGTVETFVSHEKRLQRRIDMAEAIAAGAELKDVSKLFGVSKETVKGACVELGVDYKPAHKRGRPRKSEKVVEKKIPLWKRRKQERDAAKVEIAEAVLSGELTFHVADRYGIDRRMVLQICDEMGVRRPQ